MPAFLPSIIELFGGLALFLLGMETMSHALQAAAGSRLRELLRRFTAGKLRGFAAGTALSAVIHSSATTVMVVGFLSAGLMSLTRATPVVLGANVGTTLSMVVVSIDLGAFCFAAVAIGFLIRKLARRETVAEAGNAIFGFGLLFLGMEIMSHAISPLKDAGLFRELLQWTRGDTILGMTLGVIIATIFTGVVQSSGATIAIAFTLCREGVFKDLADVFPLLLGAHMGTCVTAGLGAIGTNRRAKRAAAAHLLFNLTSTIFGAVTFSAYDALMPLLSKTVITQAALANVFTQVIPALLILPFSDAFKDFVKKLTPWPKDKLRKSFLDPSLISTPEMAILAVIKETRRVARIERDMLQSVLSALELNVLPAATELKAREQVIALLQREIQDFLRMIGQRELSRRQAVLLQFLSSASTDLSRTGEHIIALGELVRRKVEEEIDLGDAEQQILAVSQEVEQLLALVVKSLKPLSTRFKERAEQVLEARSELADRTEELREEHKRKVLAREVDPISGLVFHGLMNRLDKIAKHTRGIARVELDPLFMVKEGKLDREAPPATDQTYLPDDESALPPGLTEDVAATLADESSSDDSEATASADPKPETETKPESVGSEAGKSDPPKTDDA